MSREIIGKVNREKEGFLNKSYNYGVDKEGNVYRESYNYFFDKYTLVVICLLLLASCYYYYGIHNNPFAVRNIDKTCEGLADICSRYIPLKDNWISQHPGQELNIREIIQTKVYLPENFTKQTLNLSNE